MQARASLSFFFAGLALFFVAIVFDIVLISGGLIGVPYKAANFAQPFWLSGILIALLGLLPSYQKIQIVVAGIMAISAPLGAFAFTYTLDPPLSVVCAADYTSATADGCAMQVYSTVAYAVTGITCSALVLPAVRRRTSPEAGAAGLLALTEQASGLRPAADALSAFCPADAVLLLLLPAGVAETSVFLHRSLGAGGLPWVSGADRVCSCSGDSNRCSWSEYMLSEIASSVSCIRMAGTSWILH